MTGRRKTIAFATLVLAAAVFTATVYLTVYRPVQQTDSAAEQQVVDVAGAATVTLLSYGPQTLDADMERARSVMIGDFQTYYSKFTEEMVAPAVRDKGVRAAAQVVDSALMEIEPDTAKVLLFLNQETSSRDRPEPAVTASSVVVSLTKSGADWLISALEPQ